VGLKGRRGGRRKSILLIYGNRGRGQGKEMELFESSCIGTVMAMEKLKDDGQ
jgi:hypothetical protein